MVKVLHFVLVGIITRIVDPTALVKYTLRFDAEASFDYKSDRSANDDVKNTTATQNFLFKVINFDLSKEYDVFSVTNISEPVFVNNSKFIHHIMNGTIQINCLRFSTKSDVCKHIGCVLNSSLNSSAAYQSQTKNKVTNWRHLLTGIDIKISCTSKIQKIALCPKGSKRYKQLTCSQTSIQQRKEDQTTKNSLALPLGLSAAVAAAASGFVYAAIYRRCRRRKVDEEDKNQITNAESDNNLGPTGIRPSHQWADKTGNIRFKTPNK